MKTILSLSLALVALSSAHAQVFRSEVGHRGNRDHRDATLLHTPGQGHHGTRHSPQVHVNVGYGSGNFGYYRGSGYGYGGYRDFGYNTYSPRRGYGYWPSYSYYGGYGADYPYYTTNGYYGTTSGAANGLLLGALAGGIIGHNSGSLGHNGWRGAAWGAGVGWLLGSVADANRSAMVYRQSPVVLQQPVQVQAPPAAAAPTQPVTIINNYYNSATPMSGANSLFGR